MTARAAKALAAALALALLLALPHGLKSYGIYLLSLWAVFTIAAMGLNLTLGYAGQVSLAQGAFLGIGAYTSALMTSAGLPFVLAAATAALICFVVGVGLGFPALRVRHHYLAFVTLAFGTLVWLVMRNEEWLTGGNYGIVGIARPSVFGLSTAPPIAFYYFTLAVLGLVSLGFWGLIRSPWGRAFAALRENPLRAASLGVDLRAYTLLAFAIGAALGGLAGALYAPLVEFIDPSPFTLAKSLMLLLMVVVGGQGYFLGPFLGAALVTLLPEWLRFAEGLYLILYALLVMVLMAVCPEGLLGLRERLGGRLSGRRRPAAGNVAP